MSQDMFLDCDQKDDPTHQEFKKDYEVMGMEKQIVDDAFMSLQEYLDGDKSLSSDLLQRALASERLAQLTIATYKKEPEIYIRKRTW